MKFIPYEFVTHTMRVKRLYKKFLRDIQNWNEQVHDVRVQSVLLRQKFEEKRHIKDPVEAKRILTEAEDIYNYVKHPDPLTFSTSYEGPAFERHDVAKTYDAMLDFWHPLEKAQYPDYFAKREQRKKEFVEWYDKKFGKPQFEELEEAT